MGGSIGGRVTGELLEKGPPLCVQSRFEYLHGSSGHNIHWKLVPVRDYSDAERMLLTTSLTPLLANLQSMTSKPIVGGDSKDRVTWKVEEAVHNFLHTDKVTTNSSTDEGN